MTSGKADRCVSKKQLLFTDRLVLSNGKRSFLLVLFHCIEVSRLGLVLLSVRQLQGGLHVFLCKVNSESFRVHFNGCLSWQPPSFFACACVYVFMHIRCTYVNTHVEARGQTQLLFCFSYHPPCSLAKGISLVPALPSKAHTIYLPSTGITSAYHHTRFFYMGSGDRSLVWLIRPSILWIELCPQPAIPRMESSM